MADRIWAGTRALAQMHLDAGQRVWLVTATPVELALIIARRLGLTGALGTVAESVDGHYTGRLVGEVLHGPAKAHAVRALAVTEGLNLRRCTAYSDSVNDVPMLSAVGTAVAVNPDRDLRDIARARGWQIRDFRTGRRATRIAVPVAARGGRGGGRGGRGPAPLAVARRPRARRPSPEGVAAAAEQPVERVLDRLAHLVGEVEHQHRVVRRVRAAARAVRDRLAELDEPLRRQRHGAERPEQRERRRHREVREARAAGPAAGMSPIFG